MIIAKVGEPAPDFDLPVLDPGDPSNARLRASLAGYRGDWLVFFFYPMDFTFVCPTEILAFAKHQAEFDALGARILGCSTDTIYTHRAWMETPRSRGMLRSGSALPSLDGAARWLNREIASLDDARRPGHELSKAAPVDAAHESALLSRGAGEGK